MAVPIAAVVTAVVALPVSKIAFRLQGGYFAIGTWYLVGLGLLAIGITLVFKQGIWGYIQQRYDIRLFPVQRRLLMTPTRHE